MYEQFQGNGACIFEGEEPPLLNDVANLQNQEDPEEQRAHPPESKGFRGAVFTSTVPTNPRDSVTFIFRELTVLRKLRVENSVKKAFITILSKQSSILTTCLACGSSVRGLSIIEDGRNHSAVCYQDLSPSQSYVLSTMHHTSPKFLSPPFQTSLAY